MIKQIEFKRDFRCFKKGETFAFKSGINVLVGDQGCGKSTLIELIRSLLEDKSQEGSSYRAKTIMSSENISDIVSVDLTTSELRSRNKIVAFDFERESARDTSAIHFDMVSDQLAAMKSSHGQGNLISLNSLVKKIKDNVSNLDVILLDEPDSALSPRNCYGLLSIINGISSKWNKQIILSAHNPIIINGKHPAYKEQFWSEVLSLEDKKWIGGDVFLILQLLPPKLNHEKDA